MPNDITPKNHLFESVPSFPRSRVGMHSLVPTLPRGNAYGAEQAANGKGKTRFPRRSMGTSNLHLSLVPTLPRPSFPRSRVGMHTELSKPLTEKAGQGSHAGAWEPVVLVGNAYGA